MAVRTIIIIAKSDNYQRQTWVHVWCKPFYRGKFPLRRVLHGLYNFPSLRAIIYRR